MINNVVYLDVWSLYYGFFFRSKMRVFYITSNPSRPTH